MYAQMIAVFTAIAFLGCARLSPHFEETPSNDSLVQNGSIFESAELVGVAANSTLILPEDSQVLIDDSITQPQLYLEKKLAIFGHPSQKISIDSMRYRLGIMVNHENSNVSVSTFGEYEIAGHGGAFVKITVIVPSSLKVRYSKELGGVNSIGNQVLKKATIQTTNWHKLTTREVAS